VASASPTSVAFFFDPVCPWTWVTSRWLLKVTTERQLGIDWQVLSLGAVNEIQDDHPVWGAARVAATVRRAQGPEALGRFYTELGRRLHHDRAGMTQATYADALEASGLPGELAEAASDRALDATLRQGLEEARRLVGTDVGSPVLAIDGRAANGPVLAAVPGDTEAGELFDAVAGLLASGVFSELRRGRPERPRIE
jgi:hypothetical protein